MRGGHRKRKRGRESSHTPSPLCTVSIFVENYFVGCKEVGCFLVSSKTLSFRFCIFVHVSEESCVSVHLVITAPRMTRKIAISRKPAPKRHPGEYAAVQIVMSLSSFGQ